MGEGMKAGTLRSDSEKVAIAAYHAALRRLNKDAFNLTLKTFGITRKELNEYQAFAVDVKAGEL
jgi:hypothetical protein